MRRLTAQHAYDVLMLDHAAGALAPAQALLVETHARLRPSAKAYANALEVAGGAFLEALEPVEVSALPFAPTTDAVPGDARASDRLIAARALIEAAARTPDNLNWRWRAPGLRELRLPVAGASLIRLVGGGALAPHGHTAEELTLVLAGTFSDCAGVYGVGDIGFADEGLDHSPQVPPGDDCVCLVATTGALKFHGALARITARLLA